MLARDLDAFLSAQPWFAMLRPDERARIGARLQVRRLGPDSPLVLVPAEPMLVLVARGQVRIRGDREETLFPGDAVGSISLCTEQGLSATLSAPDALLFVLDREGFQALLAEFPAVAPAFLADLARVLSWHEELLREVVQARAESLPGAPLAAALTTHQLRLERRHRGAVRRSTAQLLRRIVVEPGRQPAFWTLLGFGLALLTAREVVSHIISSGAQKHFFALIGGATGNPIHIHHFNYGLILLSLTGMAALIPKARQALRFLGFAFGFGLGLVTDEFALLWNLNPDYYQRSSKVAMLVAGAGLLQLVYLRSVYAALLGRLAGHVQRLWERR